MMVSKHIIPWWFKKLLGVQVEPPVFSQVDGAPCGLLASVYFCRSPHLSHLTSFLPVPGTVPVRGRSCRNIYYVNLKEVDFNDSHFNQGFWCH